MDFNKSLEKVNVRYYNRYRDLFFATVSIILVSSYWYFNTLEQTITVSNLYLLIAAHWFGDFVLQSDRIATQKSSSNPILLHHIFLYTVAITITFPYFAQSWIF